MGTAGTNGSTPLQWTGRPDEQSSRQARIQTSSCLEGGFGWARGGAGDDAVEPAESVSRGRRSWSSGTGEQLAEVTGPGAVG